MSLREKVGPIGPSLGWLCAKLGLHDPDAHLVAVAWMACADAVELCLSADDPGRMKALRTMSPSFFTHTALHLDSFLQHGSGTTEDLTRAVDEYRNLCEHHHVVVAPTHPDQMPMHVYDALSAAGVPVAIENMDRMKKEGRTPEDLRTFVVQDPRYVLDIQHAYENAVDRGEDPVAFVLKFLEYMGDRLVQLHVSGEISVRGKQMVLHAPLPCATNRRVIIRMLTAVLTRVHYRLPIILEGEYLLDIPLAYTPHDAAEAVELFDRASEEMRKDRECLLNELHV